MLRDKCCKLSTLHHLVQRLQHEMLKVTGGIYNYCIGSDSEGHMMNLIHGMIMLIKDKHFKQVQLLYWMSYSGIYTMNIYMVQTML